MHLSSLSEFPEEPHWVILTTSSTHVPGDERSRTNPGHGYPAHTVTSINYNIYHDEEEWKNENNRREKNKYPYRDDYVAFKSSGRAKVTTHVSVETNEV